MNDGIVDGIMQHGLLLKILGGALPETRQAIANHDQAMREALARVEAEAGRLAEAGLAAHVRADASQAQLAEAVGLLRDYGHSTPGVHIIHAFVDRVTQAEQQEAQPATFYDAIKNPPPIAPTLQQEARPTAEHLEALKRFHETSYDGEAYDVPVETMHQLAAMGLVDPAPQYGEHGFSMNTKGYAALSPKQEAQGAQAGDELDAVAEAIFNADKDNWYSVGPYPQLHANDKARLRAMARAALATQPAEWIDPDPLHPAGHLYNQGFAAGAAAAKRLNAVRGAEHE